MIETMMLGLCLGIVCVVTRSHIRETMKMQTRIEALEAAVSGSPRALEAAPQGKSPQIVLNERKKLVSPEEKVMRDFVEAAKQHGVEFRKIYKGCAGSWWADSTAAVMGKLSENCVRVPYKNEDGAIQVHNSDSRCPILFEDGELTEEFFKRLV